MIKYSKVILEPTSEPVTLSEAKAHLRVTDDNDDAYITTLIKVARRMCEGYAGISFITQTRVMKLDSFPVCLPEEIELPFGPIQAISGTDAATPIPNTLGISYVDDDGAAQTLILDTDFYLDSSSDIPRVSPADDWPTDVDDRINAVTITYKAGYSGASNVPAEAKQAMLLQIGSLYENRQDESAGPSNMLHWSSTALLDNIKVYYNARQD
jgi:uncharacterized phiE125 gp8 family phage protein